MSEEWCSFEEYQAGSCSVEPAPHGDPFIYVEPATSWPPSPASNPVTVEPSWFDAAFTYQLVLVVAALICILAVARLLWQKKS